MAFRSIFSFGPCQVYVRLVDFYDTGLDIGRDWLCKIEDMPANLGTYSINEETGEVTIDFINADPPGGSSASAAPEIHVVPLFDTVAAGIVAARVDEMQFSGDYFTNTGNNYIAGYALVYEEKVEDGKQLYGGDTGDNRWASMENGMVEQPGNFIVPTIAGDQASVFVKNTLSGT